MPRLFSALIIFAALLFFSIAPVSACTSIQTKTTDGKVFYARTMEFEVPLHGSVFTIPAGTALAGTLPDGKPGLKWKAKHGFVGMGSYGYPTLIDGINDAGLVAGGLMFPGFAGYQVYKPDAAGRTLCQVDVINWVLSECATIADVRAGLKNLVVVQGPDTLHGVNMGAMPLHYTVHDATGASIVIEYQDGRCNIYDNPLGVLTNSPDFAWMRIYLSNFVNLSAVNAKPLDLNGFEVNPTGQGSGMRGLPGDFTPPSRFLRMVALVQSVKPVTGADAGLAQIMTIIDNVDIPVGVVRNVTPQGELLELTQWVTVADSARGRYYFHTYDNKNWNYVDVKNALAGAGAGMRNLPIDRPADYPDLTAQSQPVR